jgi:hypothetical protein
MSCVRHVSRCTHRVIKPTRTLSPHAHQHMCMTTLFPSSNQHSPPPIKNKDRPRLSQSDQNTKHQKLYLVWGTPPKNIRWNGGMAWFGLVWLRLVWIGLGFGLASCALTGLGVWFSVVFGVAVVVGVVRRRQRWQRQSVDITISKYWYDANYWTGGVDCCLRLNWVFGWHGFTMYMCMHNAVTMHMCTHNADQHEANTIPQKNVYAGHSCKSPATFCS